VLAIVRKTAMSSLKRNRKATTTMGFQEALENPIDRSPYPEERVLMFCDQEEVRPSFTQLRWEVRKTVVLREMEGFSYKEISATFDIPIGAVISRLSRGRDGLKRLLSAPSPVRHEGAGLKKTCDDCDYEIESVIANRNTGPGTQGRCSGY
jgi:DNA-directed RNA polymerase specialized sigma24 family protein